jgi:hypothetical protein
MKGLKCTEQTRIVSIGLLVVYVVYGMFKIPLLEYGSSLVIGGIVYGVTKSVEFGVLAVLLANLLLPLFRSSTEGFADKSPASKAKGSPTSKAKGSPTSKAKAQVEDEAEDEPSAEPELGAEDEEPSEAAGLESETIKDAGNTGLSAPVFTGSSTPASAKTKPAKAKKISETDLPPVNQPADLMKDGFEDTSGKPSSGLFKLGEIPTDEKGGFHIDAGTSVLNALKSLKPDQISAMTQDTKQLIETQKSLMGMLQSFKPMMSEGKEMMDTFQQMFSGPNASAMGALQAAKDTLNN